MADSWDHVFTVDRAPVVRAGAASFLGQAELAARGRLRHLGHAAFEGESALAAAGVIAIPVDEILTLEGLTLDELITPSAFNLARVHGGTPGTWVIPAGTDNDHTYVSADNIVRRTPLLVNGVPHRGLGGTRGFRFVHSDAPNETDIDGMRWSLPLPFDGVNFTLTALVTFNATNDPALSQNVAMDLLTIYEGGGRFAVFQQNMQFNGTGNVLQAHGADETGTTTRGRKVAIGPGVAYSVSLRYNGTLGRVEAVAIDNATGALVGASWCPSDIQGKTPSFVLIHDYLRRFGGHTQVDMPAFDFTHAALPLEPVDVPATADLLAVQSSISEVTLTWTSPAMYFKIERSDGGGWTTIEEAYGDSGADLAFFSYTDLTVEDIVTYTYRMTAIVGDWRSSSFAAAPITIDNDAFVPPAPELLHWPLNDGDGTAISAAVGPAGTTDGTWTSETASAGGFCLALNGSGQKAATNAAVTFAANKLTLSLWLYGTSFSTDGTYQVLIASRDATSPSSAATFLVYVRFNVLSVAVTQGFAQRLTSYALPTPNAWHHVLIEVDNSTLTGAVAVYIDNALRTPTANISDKNASGDFAAAVVRLGGLSASGSFPGRIDDVRIYNRSLTSQERAALAFVAE